MIEFRGIIIKIQRWLRAITPDNFYMTKIDSLVYFLYCDTMDGCSQH